MLNKKIILLIAYILALTFIPLESAQEVVGRLYFVPSYYPVDLLSPSSYEAELWIDDGVDSLHGFDIHIVFDPSKLAVDSVVLADLPGGYPCFCPTRLLGEGYAHLVCAVLGPDVISGQGPFLRLYFRPLEPGISIVKVDSVVFLRPDNSRIPVKRDYLLVHIKGADSRDPDVGNLYMSDVPFRIPECPHCSFLGIYDASGRKLPAKNLASFGKGFYFFLFTEPSGRLRSLRFFKP